MQSVRFEVETLSPAQTERVGKALGEILEVGDWLLLSGELGSGKTVLVRGLARGLGYDGPLTSPTFCLLQTYEGRLLLHHLDLYRLDTLAELADLGLEELAETGLLAIEWAEKLGPLAPADAVHCRLSYSGAENQRKLVFEGPAGRLQALASSLGALSSDAGTPDDD